MTKTNDQILLDAILSEQRAAWGATLRADRLFELFSAEQLLKDKDLTTTDVETGNIGQSLGRSPAAYFPRIADWLEAELMEEKNGYLRLTHKGMIVANSISVQFI